MGLSRRDLIKKGSIFGLLAPFFGGKAPEAEAKPPEIRGLTNNSPIIDFPVEVLPKGAPGHDIHIPQDIDYEDFIYRSVDKICKSLWNSSRYRTTSRDHQAMRRILEDCLDLPSSERVLKFPKETYPLFSSLHKDVTKKGFDSEKVLADLIEDTEEVNHDVFIA